MLGEIAGQFCRLSALAAIEPLGDGNINDTWLVRTEDKTFVLQRLNTRVFPSPQLIVENQALLSRHLGRKATACRQRWENCLLLPTRSGASLYTDGQGGCWRAISHIDRSVTHQTITTAHQARQIGWALGHFHHLLADLPVDKLHVTLPGFHVLPAYLDHFDRVVRAAAIPRDPDLHFCLAFVAARRRGADMLERARAQGRLREQTVHGDPKAGNVLFDAATDLAVSLIDLDTVGPGLILSDIGDCLRSCCNSAGETASDPATATFDVELCREVLAGYFLGSETMLMADDRGLIYHAVRLIAFELGLRFLTDHLIGNRYFKVAHVGENLYRALVQFHLVQSIESRQAAIERAVFTV